jgi:Na+-driven multidrug efflux pump
MDENQSILELQVDQTASKNLKDAARWAKFLSVTGFVCMGLMLIFFVTMQSQIAGALSQVIPAFSNLDSLGVLITIVIIAIAIVCLLLYFLFRGSALVRKAIETKSQETFNSGLASFKAFFTMYGILAIVGLISNLVSIF